ncbi:TPA: thioredoxin fold domain-containing protein [Klebsiella oxytoca]
MMNLLLYKATTMIAPTYNARISGNHLIASLNNDTPIFSLNVSEDPSFWIEGATLMVNLNTDSSHPVYRALDYKEAENLLSVITRELSNRKPRKQWKTEMILGAVVLVSCFAVWRFSPATPSLVRPPFVQTEPRNATAETTAPRFQGLPQLRNNTPGNPYFGNNTTLNAEDGQTTPAGSPVQPSATRPASVASQETLSPHIMQNLQKAARRGYFTVPLSSGHERTLYVFADPQCPHCQDLEPLIEALSTHYNVEIFPVTYVGGEKSSQQIQPVLYLDKDKRAVAWKKLFSIDDGMLTIGKKESGGETKAAPAQRDDKRWKVAGEALAINDVAFRQYRIPGTPWVIADDGRHVPQSMMKDPATMQAFIAEHSKVEN